MRLDSVASGAKSGSTIQYGLLGACEHPADSPYALLITIAAPVAVLFVLVTNHFRSRENELS